jgi:transportin-1
MHLVNLVPFLIQKLDCESKDVRATTCWTLSKFSEWIGNSEFDEIFVAYNQKLIDRVADKEENVQEAACNAYSSLIEVDPERCQPYLLKFFQVLNSVVDNYKDGSLIAMFDCIGSIAQAVGDNLKNPEVLNTLLPLLNKKWEQFSNSDRSLLTLFECFESVIVAVGADIEPYAQIIFQRCVTILNSVLANIKSD